MPTWVTVILDFIASLVGIKPTPPTTTTTTTPPPTTTTTARPTTTTTAAPPVGNYPPEVHELLAAHNRRRKAVGLSELILDARLVASATDHARWMAATGNFSHTGKNGSTPFQRMRDHGYYFSTAGENIAMGYNNVQSVMVGWINSVGHRANIEGSFIHVGFGVARGNNGRLYWVANFGRASSRLTMDNNAAVFLPGPLVGRDEEATGARPDSGPTTLHRAGGEYLYGCRFA